MSRIRYAVPGWGGFLTNEFIAKYDACLKKYMCIRWGYSSKLKCLYGLLHEADAHLFPRKMANNKEHCIHQLLLSAKILPMKLRYFHYFCLATVPF